MNKIEYVLLNRIIITAGLFLVFFFILLSYSGIPACVHLTYTGQECGSCGITRDIISFLKFDFATPINDNSIGFFLFGILQFIYRIFISSLSLREASRGSVANDPLFFTWSFSNSKNRVVGIKKVIITDAMITFILAVLVFLPFWI